MKTLKKIPKFKNEQEEAEFWRTHDSTEYMDWSKAKKTIFPSLKTTTESISLRLPSPLLARIKELANEKDVPYQSLMKVYRANVSSEISAHIVNKLHLIHLAAYVFAESHP